MRGSAEQSLAWAFAFVAVLAHSKVARAEEPIHYEVRANVDVDSAIVDADVTIRVLHDANVRELRLWLYADRLAVAPRGMTEMSGRWIFPGEVHLGSAVASNITVNGQAATSRVVLAEDRDAHGAELFVVLPNSLATEYTVSMHYRIELPPRFGRLGRAGDVISLAAPWYPLVVRGEGAWALRAQHHVSMHANEGAAVFLGDTVAEEATETTAYIPALVADELFTYERRVEGRRLRVVSPAELYQPPSPTREGEAGLVDWVRIDEVANMATAYRHVIQTLRQSELADAVDDVTVLMVPSRVELASTAERLVIASDRIFEVFPGEGLRSFHERALMRAMFRSLARHIPTSPDPPDEVSWADDVRAALLVDVDDARRHGHVRTPEELIGFAAFHPAVDQILYAPQIQFADAFFGMVDESDSFRDDPMRAFAPIARGRRLLESARDALGPERFATFARSLLNERACVTVCISSADESMLERLQGWLHAPTVALNYRLVSAESTEESPGNYVHRVVVARDGALRVEPVQVRVEDADGEMILGTWDGRGNEGTIELRSHAPLADVIIDPNQRLPEGSDLTDGHPRADNALHQPWRPPLLASFNFGYAASEGRLYANIDVLLHRRYDLEHAVVLELTSDAVGTGGLLRYIRGVGRKRDNNSRIGTLSLGAELSRLRDGYTEGAPGGWQASLYLLGNVDTRVYLTDPREGYGLRGSLRFGGVARDGGGVTWSGSGGVRAAVAIPIGQLNSFQLFGGVSYTVGDALPAQFQALGGRYLLRGFESGELVGRGRAYAVAEHRWTIIRDLDWNFLHLAWIREVQLAAFGGAGLMIDGLTEPGTHFVADAGGGIRMHFQYGGVQPGVLTLDLSAPLTRESRDVVVNGIVIRERSPVSFYLAFDQYF